MCELRLTNVGKTYKNKEAVRKFSYTFSPGVYGLLGESGAGKTTLLRMICGIIRATQGEIYFDDLPIRDLGAAYRKLLGYLPQDFGYYEEFTAVRFLNYMAALKALPRQYGERRIEELLEMTGLKEVKGKKLKTYSGGMLRRLGIAQALLNEPEILVLDEPTAGLDPKERVAFRNMISSLGKSRIVLLSTHIVSDVEYIGDRILIMKEGELIGGGTRQEIQAEAKGHVWRCLAADKRVGEINEKFLVSNLRKEGEKTELRIVSKDKPLEEAEDVTANLEEAYLYYTQIL